MNQNIAFPRLREQAIALRRAGKSRREIAELLNITSHETLNEALRGEPPQPWTRRPNAKDDLRTEARALREQGLDYEEIVAELGVSKSSVSLWVRDMPRPERLTKEACRERSLEIFRKYWAAQRPIREAARRADVRAAFAEIGELNDREVLIAGAIAYWCEGTKNKPYRRRIDRVAFINSDPALICFFMRFLAVAGITRDRLICRLYIHESADVDAAQRFWLEVTGLEPEQFGRPTLKRHNPTTVRKNTGNDYHGCLRIDVRRSVSLYRRIEGWAAAAMSDSKTTDDPGETALR
jgi:transcriptional regulator with XRE-family HTH domain